MVKRWSEKEVSELLALVEGGSTPDEAAKALGRTKKQLFNKLHRMGLSFGKKWSEEELDFLRTHYDPDNLEWLSSKLGRTERSIDSKALGVGLKEKARSFWTAQEESVLKRYYPTSSMGFLCKTLDRSEGSIRHAVRRLGLKKEGVSWSEVEDEILERLFVSGEPLKDIARALGRTVAAVKGRRSHLGLKPRLKRKEIVNQLSERSVIAVCSRHGEVEHRVLKSGALSCLECSKEYYEKSYTRKTEGPTRITKEMAFKLFESFGYTVVSGEFVSANDQSLLALCPEGHECRIGYTWMKMGHRCPTCAQEKRLSYQRRSSETFFQSLLSLASEEGYSVSTSTDDYINAHTKIDMVCNEGHSFSIFPYYFMSGGRCGVCCPTHSSRGEQELIEHIKVVYGGRVIPNCRELISPKEVDIYCPEPKIAIEYNGLYWHSEELAGKKDYEKFKELSRLGVRYVGIFEDEWLNRPELVKRYLSSLLGVEDKKASLRPQSLDIDYDFSDIGAFLDSYHYIGSRPGKHNIGFFWRGQPIACLQLSSPTRQSKYDLEITRMCVHPDYRVYGLWSYAKKHILDGVFSDKTLVSFSDNRLHTGNVYRQMGFMLDGQVAPDYYWCKGGTRYNKSGLRKTEEEKSSGLTEAELRYSQGYFRIYDVGKTRWVLHR